MPTNNPLKPEPISKPPVPPRERSAASEEDRGEPRPDTVQTDDEKRIERFRER